MRRKTGIVTDLIFFIKKGKRPSPCASNCKGRAGTESVQSRVEQPRHEREDKSTLK